jgi:cobalt-zinc-cadmium efflux system outer membrane protein
VLSPFPFRVSVACVVVAAGLGSGARAQEPLDVESYVRRVLRAHPGARQVAAFEAAAAASRKAGRVIPDPVVSFTWDKAHLPIGGPSETETSWSISQTIPWPGTLSANIRAGDRAADALRGAAAETRWDLEIDARVAFARVLHARSAQDIANAAEADAKSLSELTTRRAELGESREVDRIKAEVEWLRQQRTRRAAEREAAAAEAILRALAVEPLPQPLLLAGELPAPIPEVDAADLRRRLEGSNPRLASARAEAEREAALLSAAGRARIPNLDVTWFHDDEIDKEASGFSVGVRLPLWNANRGEIARARAASAQAAARAQRASLELQASLERARQELDIASDQAEILQLQILPAAERSLEIARFSYQEGETSLLDLLDAQRTFRETQREAAASRLALAVALGEVQRLVGPDFHPGR